LSRSGFGISSRGELDRVLPADPTAAAPFKPLALSTGGCERDPRK
jgi:hypothetical protein